MGKSSRLNTLLVEILIAVLFFALASTVVLESFVAARSQSRLAALYDEAAADVQNVADELYASGDYDSALESAGFAFENGGWRLPREQYTLLAATMEENAGAGKLVTAGISAAVEGKLIITVPVTLYIPWEVAP